MTAEIFAPALVVDPVDEHALRVRVPAFVDPERDIRFAVLTEAIRDLHTWRTARDLTPALRRELERLERWFRDPDMAWPFGCAALCEALHLDAQWVRAVVLDGPPRYIARRARWPA